MTSLGKQIRLRRLFRRGSGRILVVALDHAIGWGILPGIEKIEETLDLVVRGGADAVTMLKGSAERCFERHAGQIALIMKCTTFSPYHSTYDAPVGSVKDALLLGADAIAMGVTIGSDRQSELLRNLGRLTSEATAMGLPVIAHIYPRGGLIAAEEKYRVEKVAYAARTAMELGVDIVKTYYTGAVESFARVVEVASPAWVVLSGGPKMDSQLDLFRMTSDAMRAGAAGVTYGRNVWQQREPVTMLEILGRLIDEDLDPEEAFRAWKEKTGSDNVMAKTGR